MIILIEHSDLQRDDFPFDLIEFGKFHAKLIFTQINPDANTDKSFVIAKSIYHEQGQTVDKAKLLNLIENAL